MNIFKTKKTATIIKTDQELIDEIHHEFDSAQDRLLIQAEDILKAIDIPDKTNMERQAERLKSIGFINTPTVSKGDELKKQRQDNIQKVVETKEQADTIQYYKQTYPFLKFITEDELNRICQKYGLIHAPVGNYIKEVPEKNIRNIERAQALKGKDVRELEYKFIPRDDDKERFEIFLKSIGKTNNIFKKGEDIALLNKYSKSFKNVKTNPFGLESTTWLYDIWGNTGENGYYSFSKIETINKQGLFIAAPPSHFNLEGLKKKSEYGFFEVIQTEIKDPIVFRYVNGGIQIITKWGLEAEDPLLVNPVNN